MFCPNCGTQIADGTVICPSCNTQLSSSIGKSAPPERSRPTYVSEDSQPVGATENSKGKGYAAIATALMLFPTLICLVADYLGPPEILQRWFPSSEWAQPGVITWSAYLLGAIMCLWMLFVLPAIKPKKPLATILLCVSVITLYQFFLAYINNGTGLYVKYILPAGLIITLSSAILSILLAYKIIPKGHTLSAIAVEAGLVSVGLEILFDVQRTQQVDLRWSLIFATTAVCVVGFYEAVSYAIRINKK